MWKSMLKLNDGEMLVEVGRRIQGVVAEEEISDYSVVSASGNIVGSVTHYDTDSISNFHRIQRVVQRDSSNNVVLETSF